MKDKLILGTVQLGLNYGINNSADKPTSEQSLEILSRAYATGIRILDTANAYGNAIELIGTYHQSGAKFKIISKFGDELGVLDNELIKLGITSFEAYLFHKYTLFENANEELKTKLIALKHAGKIKSIGVSVYTTTEFKTAIDASWIDVIQIPFNVLDNENVKGNLMVEAKQKNKTVHVRSIFLQGLFYMNLNMLPSYLKPLQSYLSTIHNLSHKFNLSINQLCLLYTLANKNVDGVLFGVDSLQQLNENIAAIEGIMHTKNVTTILAEVNETVSVTNDHLPLLNPVNWKN